MTDCAEAILNVIFVAKAGIAIYKNQDFARAIVTNEKTARAASGRFVSLSDVSSARGEVMEGILDLGDKGVELYGAFKDSKTGKSCAAAFK